MGPIRIDIDDAQVQRAIAAIRARLVSAAPLMHDIAGILRDSVEENFKQQGRPAWLGFKPPVNPRRAGGRLLQDKGRLAASVVRASDATTAQVGTNVVYAAIHQFGGRTRPHVIRPRNKKALAFGGGVFRQVNHPGSEIPARPFLDITEVEDEKILDHASAYLRSSIGS